MTSQTLEFRPDELVILEEACRVGDRLAELRDVEQNPKVIVEVRLQQEQLRKLLASVDWPGDTPSLSEWGRTLAHRRWH